MTDLTAEAIREIRDADDNVANRIYVPETTEYVLLYEQSCGERTELVTVDLERFQPNPRRKRGTVTVTRLDDFVRYVNDHRDTTTIVFADRDALTFTAYLNYHQPGSVAALAGWADHVARYVVQETPEWASWRTFAAWGWYAHDEFAEFLEDHLVDVVEPDPAELFETVTDPRPSVEIPEKLTLRLRLWEGDDDPTDLHPRLRHRLRNGNVEFRLVFGNDVARMLRDRFHDYAITIEELLHREEHSIPVLFGRKE